MGSLTAIRPAAHAGSFYEAGAHALRAHVREMLDAVEQVPALERVHGIVVPHAGHIFSGPPAAHAYRLIEGRPYRRVVVIAPSHWEWFEGVATHLGTAFETPLGTVPLDREMCRRLTETHAFITDLPRAHAPEHSIEVELPFLQVVLSDWQLVPLLAAKQSWRLMRELGEALGRALSGDPAPTLIVASSDLYHGEDVETCCASDERCAQAIAAFDPEVFLDGVASRDYQACGAGPIAAAMVAARALGANRCEILNLTNSSETHPGLAGRVVGYLSAAFHEM